MENDKSHKKNMSVNRRDFLLGVISGGAVLAVIGSNRIKISINDTENPSYEDIAKLDIFKEEHLHLNAEKTPDLQYYPLTSVKDLFLIFTNVMQMVFPKLRALEDYKNLESKIFYSVQKQNFFIFGNDYARRIQEHYNNNVVLPPDRNVATKLLEKSLREYPLGWSEIFYAVLTYDAAIVKSLALKGEA